MNESDLKGHLRRLDLQPSRKLGQSFLVDTNTSRWIAAQLEAGPEDTVIEVGPGFGALTAHLAGKVKRLILVEKDGRLAEFLKQTYGPAGVEVIHGDATEFDVRSLFLKGPVKFIGNLPYSAGSEIMRVFLDAPSPICKAVIMLQKEVADRLCAIPKTKPYGMISLVMQTRWDIARIKTVGPALFHPRPEVDSTIIKMTPRSEATLPRYCPEVFVQTVKQGFSQRRKQLHNNLPVERERWDAICSSLGLKESIRAEELDLEQWVKLSSEIERHPCHSLPPSAEEELDFVDENDNVLGQMARREIHAQKKLHRAVHVFLLNKAGELYLQLRSAFKDTHPGKWDSSASGHVDPGESYLDCAIRESWEEVWTRPKGDFKKFVKISASEKTDLEFIEVFEAEAAGKIKVHTSEIHSGRFFPVQQIEEWIAERPEDFATGFRTCFQEWIKARGS
ncbi:MAG: 16S rRNA (adenine(1518)-N(6)/adenine(1519)-N(6))-dimethyltransferase RsmA [Verrucomicrobiales bacterium]|nr:16S rRNA (adenine(1518)-N(6)/adenine(1519)-N(6))-dimethyltransferase RsmA [Verrucomicrobiales bacterium]